MIVIYYLDSKQIEGDTMLNNHYENCCFLLLIVDSVYFQSPKFSFKAMFHVCL